jgi:molecular chaperone GrpE
MDRSRRNRWGGMDDFFGTGMSDDMLSPYERRRTAATRRRQQPEEPPRAEHEEGPARPADPQPAQKNPESELERHHDRDLLQRVQADFVNYKRRVEQEREDQARSANRELILKLLPALDDLQRALRSAPEGMADTDWFRGMALVERKLTSTLEEEGLEVIEAEGEEFDPHEHEAIFCEECGQAEVDIVKSVVREGYKLNGKVIRPAQVVVSKAADSPPEPAKLRVTRRRA